MDLPEEVAFTALEHKQEVRLHLEKKTNRAKEQFIHEKQYQIIVQL